MEILLELIHPSANTPQVGPSSCPWPWCSSLCHSHIPQDLAVLDAASELAVLEHHGCCGLAWALLPLLGVEKGAERGIGTWYNITGCCRAVVPALADLCSRVRAVERLSFPLPIKVQHQHHGKKHQSLVFLWLGLFWCVALLCRAPPSSAWACASELWGEAGVNRPLVCS